MKWEIILLLLVSCPAWADRPEWVSHTERQVIGGDIIHWGMSQAKSPEIALFKARQMAIKALIEECGGIANKEIIPRKQYVESQGYTSEAFATVSLDFDACEHAKKGRAQENPKIAEEQKLYEKLLGFDGETPASIEAEVLKAIRSENDDMRSDLAALTQEVHSMHPVVMLPSKIQGASSSMKAMCQAQARNMQSNLQMKAIAYNGNVAAPELWQDFNAYQQQAHMCEGME